MFMFICRASGRAGYSSALQRVALWLVAVAATALPALGQPSNNLRIDNSAVSPFVAQSGQQVTLSFRLINSGTTAVNVNGIDVSIDGGPWSFVSMPFPSPPNSNIFRTYSYPVRSVNCTTEFTTYSIAFRVNYNDNRTLSGGAPSGLIAPPTTVSITSQPSSATVCAPGAVRLTVNSSGTQARFAWQWRRSGTTTWIPVIEGYNTDASSGLRVFFVEGANASNPIFYAPPDTSPLRSTDFRVTVSNMCNTVVSNTVQISRTFAPTISTQPVGASSCTGSGVFSIVAADANGYQWQIEDPPGNWISLDTSPVPLPSGGQASATPLSGTSTRITVSGRSGTFNVRCVVANVCASTQSVSATLSLESSPTITQAPSSVALCWASPASFSMTATGPDPLSYRWRWRIFGSSAWIDMVEGGNIDATSPGFSFSAVGAAASTVRLTGTSTIVSMPRHIEVQGLASNACGDAQTDAVTWSTCPSDFNCSGEVSVQDLFDFLAAYFADDMNADVNRSSTLSVQDLFDYLAEYFVGCA